MRPTVIRVNYAVASARRLRESLNLAGPPVPIEEIIDSYDIPVKYSFDIEKPTLVRINNSKVSNKYAILIPPSVNAQRDRWSLGHEFAHFYLRHYETYPVDRIIKGCYVQLLTERERYILDRECDIFVTELYMPKKWVMEAIEYPVTLREAGQLKDLFQVSWEAMINRLVELKLIENREKLFAHKDKTTSLTINY